MHRKALSLPLLIALVVGNMIGTGIYVLPGPLTKYGAIALLGWVVTAIGALLIALTLTFLNKRYPKTGGPYFYCRKAFGKLVGFIIAYTYWASYLASVAGLTVASVSYFGFFDDVLNSNSPSYHYTIVLAIELIILWLFTLINIIGLHTAGVVQAILTVIKIIPLIVITLLGFHYVNFTNFPPLTHGAPVLSSLAGATTLTFWAFIGLESATVPAESTGGYKDIYKATVFGTLFTSIVYLSSTFVLMGMVPANDLMRSQFPFAVAATQLFGPHAAFLIAVCAVISGLGALNASILVQGQIVFAAARDHMFPKLFAKISKNDVPIAAQLLSSTIITIFLLLTMQKTILAQFDSIALVASLLTLITYFCSILAEMLFEFKETKSWKRIIFSIPLLAAIFSFVMIFSFDTTSLIAAIVIILICIPIYYLTVRKYVEPQHPSA